MTGELSVDYPHQKQTFISKLNPESPPFLPSSFYQHIQEVLPTKFTAEDSDNHLRIQPLANGFDDSHSYYSTTIHPIELSDENVSHAHYIEEMIPDNRHSTTSSHIEPVDVSRDDLVERSESSHEEDEDLKKEPRTSQSISSSSTSSNHPELSPDESREARAQHDLDKEAVPLADPSLHPTPSHHESNPSSNQSESEILDSRPSTELELPYEQHSSSALSTSLPDVVTETPDPNEPDDVLGNRSLLKQTITPGVSNSRPIRNNLATVSYKLFLVDEITKESRLIEIVTNESFFVGEYDILPAIDIVIQLMDCGEHAIIESDVRHCYGDKGCEEKHIPPVSAANPYKMKIDLEFHDWKDAPDIPSLSINERLQWSDRKRQRGNFSYRRKDYSSALQCYRHALTFLDTDQHPLPDQDEERGEQEENKKQSLILTERYIQVQNNLAQVYLLNNQYEQCLEAVDAVFKHDPKNIKAQFRRGKALFELGHYDQAVQPLKLLLQSPSKDVERDKVSEMLTICETQLAKYEKNEKEIYKRMFQSKTTPQEKPSPKPVPKVETKSSNGWWPYLAMGSAVAAAVGLAAAIKYR